MTALLYSGNFGPGHELDAILRAVHILRDEMHLRVLLVGSAFGGGSTDAWEYDPVNHPGQSLAGYVGTPYTTSGHAGGPLPATGWSEMPIGSDASLNLGDYSGYPLLLTNDNEGLWYTRLYRATGSYWSGWGASRPDTRQVLPLDFTAIEGPVDGRALGLAVGGYLDRVGGNPRNSRGFHFSAVPVPGAVLLGLLGLAAAGLSLRSVTRRWQSNWLARRWGRIRITWKL